MGLCFANWHFISGLRSLMQVCYLLHVMTTKDVNANAVVLFAH
jgi:hypothetical protein